MILDCAAAAISQPPKPPTDSADCELELGTPTTKLNLGKKSISGIHSHSDHKT